MHRKFNRSLVCAGVACFLEKVLIRPQFVSDIDSILFLSKLIIRRMLCSLFASFGLKDSAVVMLLEFVFFKGNNWS